MHHAFFPRTRLLRYYLERQGFSSNLQLSAFAVFLMLNLHFTVNDAGAAISSRRFIGRLGRDARVCLQDNKPRGRVSKFARLRFSGAR